MAIQNRRGAYADFDPQKLVPGEWAVVQSGDPNSERGKAVYMAFEVGDVERMATYEDMLENIDQATSDIQTQFTNELTQTITNANSAVSDMQDDIDAEIQSASSAVSALTTQVNTAIASANTATTNANTATNRANDAVDAIQAIIDSDTAVLSWNGRAGEVEPQAGDYTSAQITHGSSTVANMLTFDSAPTNGSQRAVQSGGVYSIVGNTSMGTDATTLTGAIAELLTKLQPLLDAITIDANNNVHFKNLQSGTVTHTHGSGGGTETTDVVFATPFTVVPNVVATATASNPEVNRATAYAITKTGFTLATYRNAAGTLPAKWIAFV